MWKPKDPSSHPISVAKWVDVNLLEANSWNPNHVMGPEMQLLALSLTKQGWIQPILVWPDPQTSRYVIIDGFHRHLVAKTNKDVWAMTDGLVPVVVMDMSVPERMLLTIRINRAKGNHAAIRMHEIVAALVNVHGISKDTICKEIGADIDEVQTLMAENVFEKKQVDKFNYSRAWVPHGIKNWGMTSATGETR